MEPQQEVDWNEAQKIPISVDLVVVAKKQLQFLAAVDRNCHLYDGPALERAIYRYNACWLPLLAKHSESHIYEGPLVVPLDCEWVWHCHRLNPVRYKSDCEELYGRVLDNFGVVSTVEGICGRQTEEIWSKLYPDEPYNADLINLLPEDISERISVLEKYTKYDLISAAKRQSPFFYQMLAFLEPPNSGKSLLVPDIGRLEQCIEMEGLFVKAPSGLRFYKQQVEHYFICVLDLTGTVKIMDRFMCCYKM